MDKTRDEIREDIERLKEIKEEILELIREAEQIIRDYPESRAAENYWIPNVVTALTRQHDYLGGAMITMEESIEELEELLTAEEEVENE